MAKTIALCCFVSLMGVTGAHAQKTGSFDQLSSHLKTGARVEVVDTSGRAVPGRIESLTGDSLTIRPQMGSVEQFRREQVREIRRPADGIKNGTFIGMGAGFAAGCALGAASFDSDATFNIPDTRGGVCLLAGALGLGVGAGAGLAIDALVGRGGSLVYRSPAQQIVFAPSIGATRAAAQVHLRW